MHDSIDGSIPEQVLFATTTLMKVHRMNKELLEAREEYADWSTYPMQASHCNEVGSQKVGRLQQSAPKGVASASVIEVNQQDAGAVCCTIIALSAQCTSAVQTSCSGSHDFMYAVAFL